MSSEEESEVESVDGGVCFAEEFDWSRLENCATDETVCSRVFVTRHNHYYYKWHLEVVPKRRNDQGVAFYLNTSDYHDVVSGEIGLLCTGRLRRDADDPDFNSDNSRSGFHAFAPSLELLKSLELRSLELLGLVADGGAQFSTFFDLNESDFDPLQRLSMPLLTPNTDRTNRQLFANLRPNDRRGTDFTITVGVGETKKEVAVSRLALSEIPFFDRMFAGDKLKDGVLEFPSHNVDAVMEALRFIYLNEVGENLTRFLPSVLSLAFEWGLESLMVAVEIDMIRQLQSEEKDEYDNAADYFEWANKYDRKVVDRVAACKLIDNWPQFIASPKAKNMKEELKELTCVMAAMAAYNNVFTRYDPLRCLTTPSLTPNGGVCTLLFNNIGTDVHRGTDFVIAVGEEKTELHVSSLALTIVPFFERMFGNYAWKEVQDGVLHLPMHTVDAVREVLRFIYLNVVGENLTRFLPSVLSLAHEWELNDFMAYIDRDMITKLRRERCNYDYNLAADYLELADTYDRKVVGRLAMINLIDAWPQFIISPEGKGMKEELKEKVTCAMASAAGGTNLFDDDDE